MAGVSVVEIGGLSELLRFNWGLGRELYTAPFIWIPADTVDIRRKEKAGEQRYYTNDRFHVWSIAYDGERSIKAISIVNARGQVVYRMGALDELQGVSAAGSVAGTAAGPGTSPRSGPAGRSAGRMQADARGTGDRGPSLPSSSTGKAGDVGAQAQPGQSMPQGRGTPTQGKDVGGKAGPARPGAVGISQEQWAAMDQELDRTGVALGDVLQRYGLGSAEQMGQDVYRKATRSLKRSKSRGAA